MLAAIHFIGSGSLLSTLSHTGRTSFLQEAVDAEVWFPAVAVAACIILFGLILIYILRMGTTVHYPRNATSREKFSNFFNQAEVGIGVIDEEGFFVLSNKSLQDLTGYTATQLTTIGFSSLFADRDDYVEPSKVAGMLDKFGESHQVFLRQRSGALIRVRFLVLPSPPTIKENAEVLLIEAASAEGGGGGDQLSEHDTLQDAKDSFLATLSHDLKSPLTVILGSASLMASEQSYSHELVEAILQSGQRLLNEIDALLLTRAQRKPDSQPLPVDIDGVLVDAVRDFTKRAESKNVAIDLIKVRKINGSLNHIALDRLVNLLLDVSLDRLESGRIIISLEYDKGILTLSIENSGESVIAKTTPVEIDRRVGLAGELVQYMSGKLTTTPSSGSSGFTVRVPMVQQSLVAIPGSMGKAA